MGLLYYHGLSYCVLDSTGRTSVVVEADAVDGRLLGSRLYAGHGVAWLSPSVTWDQTTLLSPIAVDIVLTDVERARLQAALATGTHCSHGWRHVVVSFPTRDGSLGVGDQSLPSTGHQDNKGMSGPLRIMRVPINEVLLLDDAGHKRYNDANHWTDGVKPADYDAVSASCHTSAWLPDITPARPAVRVQLRGVQWLVQAQKIWSTTGGAGSHGIIPALFVDEVQDAQATYGRAFDGHTPWFVRAENVSLKYGVHGCGPYRDLLAVLESIVSAPLDHSPVRECRHGALLLYLFPWIDIDPAREFRVFVYNHRVTAISQQHIYACFPSLCDASVTAIASFASAVTAACAPMTFSAHYVADVAVLPDGTPYFIEANPFGAEYTSGSALFHWLRDDELLRPRSAGIAFAITTPASTESTESSETS